MSRTRRATLVTAGATLCAGALLGGTTGLAYAQDNGIADMTVAEIAKKSREAVRASQSLHIRMTMDSAKDADDPRTVDLAVDRSGNCAGTVGYAGNGGNFEIIKRGNDVWLKPDSAWWRANFGAEAAEKNAQLEGKYLQGAAGDGGLEDAVGLCDLSEYQDTVDEGLGSDSLKKGEEKTVGDAKAIELTGKDDGADVTVAVATEGKPYPVKVARSGSDAEEATFTFDQPVPANTPPAAETEQWPKQQ